MMLSLALLLSAHSQAAVRAVVPAAPSVAPLAAPAATLALSPAVSAAPAAALSASAAAVPALAAAPAAAESAAAASADAAPVYVEPDHETVQREWSELRAFVKTLKPDGDVGGVYLSKKFGDVELMWKLDEEGGQETIRIYLEKGEQGGDSFHVTYHNRLRLSDELVVLRRFVGKNQMPWRADTIDLRTGEYLGRQGVESVPATADERRLLRDWAVGVRR